MEHVVKHMINLKEASTGTAGTLIVCINFCFCAFVEILFVCVLLGVLPSLWFLWMCLWMWWVVLIGTILILYFVYLLCLHYFEQTQWVPLEQLGVQVQLVLQLMMVALVLWFWDRDAYDWYCWHNTRNNCWLWWFCWLWQDWSSQDFISTAETSAGAFAYDAQGGTNLGKKDENRTIVVYRCSVIMIHVFVSYL